MSLTPQEALNLLDNVCAQVSGNRTDHVRIQQAIQILQEAIAPVHVPTQDTKADKASEKDE